jgi:hypothetical protein
LSFAILNQREHDRNAFAAAIGTGEEPCLAAESNSARRALGSIVAQADTPVFQEPGKSLDALEHVVRPPR